MTTKRYYWLKLKVDFFDQKEIKMLRKIAGGDTYTIIYLKMLLMSLKNDGKIYFDGIADSMVEEIALEIDEDVENVQITFNYLQSKNLVEFCQDDEIEMSDISTMIGSESDKASMMRRLRRQRKLNESNNVTHELPQRYTEIEKELDIEIDIEKDKPSKADALNEEFDKWWELYGKRGNRKPALQKFKTCRKKHSFDQIINGTKEYLKTVTDKKFQKHGSTFLNAEGYMDDYTQDANYNLGASNEVSSMEEELGLKTEPTREFTQEEIEEFNREELQF